MKNGQKEKMTKSEYDIKYAREHIKRVPLDMRKEDYEKLQEAASAAGEKINRYIKNAIAQRMEREGNAAGGYGISEGSDIKE